MSALLADPALRWTELALELGLRSAAAWACFALLEGLLARSDRRAALPRLRMALWSAWLAAPLVAACAALSPRAPAWPSSTSLVALLEPRLGARAAAPAELALALAGAWLSGWLALELALVARGLRTRRALARSPRAPARVRARADLLARRLGLRRGPRVLVGASEGSPFVHGLWRASVVVPRELCARGRAAELELVLLHELAHLARRDPWLAAAWTQLALLAWPSPCAWSARARARVAQELACDARVLRAAPALREAYRALLAAHARSLLAARSSRSAGALGLLGRASALRTRLEALGPPRSTRPAHARFARAAAAPALLAGLLLLAPSAPHRTAARGGAREPGCLRLRYCVLAELARADASLSPNLASPARKP